MENQNLQHSVSEEYQIRLEKVSKLRAMGIEPWPAAKDVTAHTQTVLQQFKKEVKQEYELVGRVMAKRLHGKAAFLHIQDMQGRLQVYIKVDEVGQHSFELLEHFIDLGDIIWVKGYSFLTQRGEITLHVEQFSLQSKCLRPLPEKFHGLTDVETRYRQRYLDLITNHETKDRFIQRTKIIQACRHFLVDKGYLEVETPMLHPIPGGAAARPFVTHHNALDDEFYLRIAPELYLKRLVVGGFEKVFEINRNFRNEGVSTRHNPEFTMLECYTAHKDYVYGMQIVEDMIRAMVASVYSDMQTSFGDYQLDFAKPFARLKMDEAVKKYNNLDVLNDNTADALIAQHKLHMPKKNMNLKEKIYLLFEETVESKLIQPTFIIGFPVEVSPLAKKDAQDSEYAARAELFIAGMEISNLFTELNDPIDQAERFQDQLKAYEDGDDEAHSYDADFIMSLEYALAPTVGFGIGIDRLIMLITNTTSIKDVILFPTLKRKE